MSERAGMPVDEIMRLDMQTHAYIEDGDTSRIAAGINLAARILMSLEDEGRRLGLSRVHAQAKAISKKPRITNQMRKK
jgi:hypothetical protein